MSSGSGYETLFFGKKAKKMRRQQAQPQPPRPGAGRRESSGGRQYYNHRGDDNRHREEDNRNRERHNHRPYEGVEGGKNRYNHVPRNEPYPIKKEEDFARPRWDHGGHGRGGGHGHGHGGDGGKSSSSGWSTTSAHASAAASTSTSTSWGSNRRGPPQVQPWGKSRGWGDSSRYAGDASGGGVPPQQKAAETRSDQKQPSMSSMESPIPKKLPPQPDWGTQAETEPPRSAVQGEATESSSSNTTRETGHYMPRFRTEERKEKTWDEMTYKEKLLAQFRNFDNFARMEDFLPTECFTEPSNERVQKKEEAAKHAINVVLEHCKTTYPPVDDYDDDSENSTDSFDGTPYTSHSRHNPYRNWPFEPVDIKRFFHALPKCLAFTIGFDVIGLNPSDEENCHCPCGPHMEPWRNQNNLENFAGKRSRAFCSTSKRMTPVGLMGHLTSLISDKGCILHYGIKVYLRYLYSNFRKGMGHKALYQPMTDEYNKAVAAEKKEAKESILLLQKALDEEKQKAAELERKNREQIEKMELLKKVNTDLYEQVKMLEHMKQVLDVEEKAKTVISTAMWKDYRNSYSAFLDAVKKVVFSISPGYRDTDPRPIKIKVEQKFLLNDLFEQWSEDEQDDKTFLFRELNLRKDSHYHSWKLLMEWNVHYEQFGMWGRTKKEQEERRLDQAVDDGGPTREFLSQVWQQLGDLAIRVRDEGGLLKKKDEVDFLGVTELGDKCIPGKIIECCDDGTFDVQYMHEGKKHVEHQVERRNIYHKIKLFELQETGVIPTTDGKLRYDVAKSLEKPPNGKCLDGETIKLLSGSEKFEHIIRQASRYYRAIGRIMLHSLITKHAISCAAVPSFFQNILFRGCEPQDKDYHDSDVLKHLSEITPWLTEASVDNLLKSSFDDILDDGNPEIITRESFFEYVIPEKFVKSREVSLCSLREGLTLNDLVDVPPFLHSMPLEAVYKLVFSKPSLAVQDVIQILTPKYTSVVNEKEFDRIHIENQQYFFDHILKQVLMDRTLNVRTKQEENDTLEREELERSGDFLSRFVSFCTGLSYIPHLEGNPDFEIFVEFDFCDMEKESLPKAHTCAHTIAIPGWVYDLDRDIFEQKLDQALDFSKDVFTMT